MAFGFTTLLNEAGWMAAGAFVSLGILAVAQRLHNWRAQRAASEWDPY